MLKLAMKQAAPAGLGSTLIVAAAILGVVGSASAQSLEQSLIAAYGSNATLNAQRAGTRAADENVPRALSGYPPTITGAATADRTSQETTTNPQTFPIIGTIPRS